MPSVRARFQNQQVYFIQDLSAVHQAKAVKAWFREHPQFNILPWPPKGADINPIENHWGNMVKDLEYFRPKSADEVFERAQQCWDSYRGRQDYWAKLATSMINRLRLVIESQGFWTKY